jgi:TPR repeat protein
MSALSNRPVVWGGVVAAFVAAAVAAYVTTSRHDTSAATAPSSTAQAPSPGGQSAPQAAATAGELPVASMRQTDPGQEYYRQGRYDLAIAFWTRAAGAGDALAAHQLGVEYMDGKPWVVPRDYDRARKYHLQAAGAGDPRSMFDLGSMYEFGLGVTIDLKQAAIWYGHAADYGHAQGAYNFATMLESGEAGHKDEVEAYKYYLIAADNGFTGVPYDNNRLRIDRNAPEPMDILAKRLTPAQISDATARAKAFKIITGPLKT